MGKIEQEPLFVQKQPSQKRRSEEQAEEGAGKRCDNRLYLISEDQGTARYAQRSHQSQ